MQRDPASGRIVGQVRQGGGSELRLAETANDDTRRRMKNEDQDEDKDGDDDDNGDDDVGAGGESATMVDDARVGKGGVVELREGSQKLTQELTERPSRRGGADWGTNVYDNPLLRVDEDEDYEYVEDGDGVMVVARTPHRKGERPSLKAATARAMAAEEKIRRLEEQVQGLQAQLRGDYVVQAEELKEPGYTGDAADQVIILDMALDFARVRVKTAERELKDSAAKLKKAEEGTAQWRRRGEEAEEKLRTRVQEAGEREKEEKARMVGVVAAADAEARAKCDYDWKLRNYKTLVEQAEDRTRHAKEREAGATAGLARSVRKEEAVRVELRKAEEQLEEAAKVKNGWFSEMYEAKRELAGKVQVEIELEAEKKQMEIELEAAKKQVRELTVQAMKDARIASQRAREQRQGTGGGVG